MTRINDTVTVKINGKTWKEMERMGSEMDSEAWENSASEAETALHHSHTLLSQMYQSSGLDCLGLVRETAEMCFFFKD